MDHFVRLTLEMTWGETEYTQAKGKRQRDKKVAVSPSCPLSCYVASFTGLQNHQTTRVIERDFETLQEIVSDVSVKFFVCQHSVRCQREKCVHVFDSFTSKLQTLY